MTAGTLFFAAWICAVLWLIATSAFAFVAGFDFFAACLIAGAVVLLAPLLKLLGLFD